MTMDKKDLVIMAKMGTTKCSSVMYFLLNPSKESEEALNYLLTINDVKPAELDILRRFSTEHKSLLGALKGMKSNSEEYCKYCSFYGEELIDFLVEVIQQC